jgi:hypothetical protein
MSVLLTQIEIREGLTTHTGNMDTLSYKGGLWLVPTWKPAKTEGMRAPQRLVRPQLIAFQPAAPSHPGADYFLSCLVPKSVLALQLFFPKISESMGNHDSNIVDACSVD